MGEVITIDANDIKDLSEKLNQKELEIISASIKDELCNYGYELLTGRNIGDKIPTRKGAHFIHQDLQKAFNDMDVFLSHIDGVFNSWINNQTHISELESKLDSKDADLKVIDSYHVSSIKITGQEENKALIIGGFKNTIHGDISFQTPKIKLNGTYLYLEELETRLLILINEVEQYMDGKRAPEYEQLDMSFDEDGEDDFANAKVD